ncbi:insulin-like peptide receptor [Penaeus chinensis]|uniref:insulin-like peptide receptor n=1 Tax=Penaeus chinensis TaxID=139456 RepID=UPI001FB6E5EE|nr:insulin-like peptide receptor [Penaeus chinensis]
MDSFLLLERISGICEQECTSGCVGGECCHQECVGGCSSPRNASSCVSCRHVLLRGSCLEACPPNMYKMYDNTCVTMSECRKKKGFLVEDTRKCEGCPPNHREHRGVCVQGRDVSRSRVDAVVSSISQAENLRRYTSVHSLVISIAGGENVERELQRCLANIQEVEDYVKIFKTNITSTEILPNLRAIHGKNLVYNNYSLVVLDNPNLRTLAPWTNPDRRFSIGRGKVFFQANPRLCLDQIYSLVTSANLSSVSETDVSTFSNGQRASCEVYELPAQVKASPHYGTLLITVGPVPSTLLASVNAYYISYRKATHNATQYEETCKEFTPKTSASGVFDLQLLGLESATRYAVYVKAFSLTPGGTVVQSAIKYAFTSPFNPSQPVGLGWASPKSSELELWWSKPVYPNGAVDHYLVTLVMVPRVKAISRDFCSPSVDITLKAIAQRAEEKQDSYLKMRKQRWEEDLASSKTPEANTCSVPPRCCSCGGGEGEKEYVEERENKSTQDFELYIMDDDMYKEVIYTRSQRKLQSKSNAQEPPFQDALQGSFVPGRDAHWNSDLLQASLTGGNSGPSLLPVGLQHVANNYTKIIDGGTNKRRETLRHLPAHYQLHYSNSTHRVQDTNSSYFRVVHQLTRDLHLSVRNLRHHTLYAVGVVACHAPTNCTYTVEGETPEAPSVAKYHLCKLCSSVPAQAAATTALNNTSDIVPDVSLAASVDNTSASVSLSWAPPSSSNGEVLSYLYYCALHQSPKSSHCVTRTQFEEAGRQVILRDLVPGKYSCWVRVRSEVGDGPESAPITFVIPDMRAPEDKAAVWWAVGVAIVAISALIGLSLRRHRSRHKIPDTMDEVENNPFYREGFAPSEMFRENYILWRDDLRVLFDHPLGHGYFGMVFAGELKGGGGGGGGAKRVAVKTHSESASTEEIKQFLKEAAMMQDIRCHHVVEFIGVVGDYAPVYVVMELMQEGDLKSLLKKQKGAAITDQKVLEMAVEAADGMSYLASRRLVHRDLAARNCMLDHSLTLKIGDFGLTRNLKSDYYRREGQGLLPVKWMAPESLKFSRYSTQSDVWSYGVLLWEMATRGVTPYKNNTNDDVIRLVVENKATLPRPRNCPDPVYKVMRRCWKFNPCDRPTFPSITKYLLKQTGEQFQDSFEQVSFIHNAAREASRHCSGSEARPGYMAEASQEEDSFYHDLNNTSDLSDEGSLEKEASREQKRPDARPPAARSHALRCPRRPLHLASRLQSLSQRRFPPASPPSPQSSAAAPLLAVGESAVRGSAVGSRVPPAEASVPTQRSGSSSSHRLPLQRNVHVYTNFITRELPHEPRPQAASPWPARCGFSPRAQGHCLCPVSHLLPRVDLTTGTIRPGTDLGPPCLSCAAVRPAQTTCKNFVTRCASPSSGALPSPGALEAPLMGYMSEPQTPAQQHPSAPPPAAASAPSSPSGSSSRGAEPFGLQRRKPRPLSRVRLVSSHPRALTRKNGVPRTDRNAQSIFEISTLCQKELLPLAVSTPFLSAGAARWAENHQPPSDTSETSSPRRVRASESSAATHATHFDITGSLKEPPVYTMHDQASLPTPPVLLLSSGSAAPSNAPPPAVATASPSCAEPSATAVLPPTSSSSSTAPASADSLAPPSVPSPKILAVFSATSDLGNRHSSRSPAAARRQRDLELM